MGKDKLYEVPHDLKCCECESELYLAELHCPNCEARPALILRTETVDEVPCSIGLFCRVRSEGETMRSGDIVLISDTLRPLGFHTDFYHYFAGLKVVEGMTGKIICKAT